MPYMHKTLGNKSVCYMFLQPKNVPKEQWMIHTRLEKMNSKGQQNNRYKIMIFKLYVPQLNCYFFVNTVLPFRWQQMMSFLTGFRLLLKLLLSHRATYCEGDITSLLCVCVCVYVYPFQPFKQDSKKTLACMFIKFRTLYKHG